MRLLIAVILSFNFAFAPLAYANDSSAIEARDNLPVPTVTTENQLVIQAPMGAETANITVSEIPETSTEEIQKILADPNARNSDILLSTDEPSVVEAVAQSTSGKDDKRLLRLIPIGRLAATTEKIASGFRSYYTNATQTLMHDKIGLTVLTITVGADSMIWLNASSFDLQQKTTMILLNLVMAATFGLDRELWGNINKPVQKRIIKIFDRFIKTGHAQMTKTLASQYISNFSLGLGIQVLRTGLLSLDNIADVVTTGEFWLTAAKISGLVTLTTFAWSELYAGVKRETDPVAKLMLRRFGDMRGVIMAHFATVSMVLQPEVYGSSPAVSYIIHGTIGLLALMHMKHIVRWLQSSKYVRPLYQISVSFEKFINDGLSNLSPHSNEGAVKSCRALFLN